MNDSWVSLAIVWTIVEAVQYFRKIPFPRRMIAPLGWVTVVAGLMAAGYATPESNHLVYFAIGAIGGAIGGSLFYGLRLLLAKLWRGSSERATVANSNESAINYLSILKKAAISIAILIGLIALAIWANIKYSDHQRQQERAAYERQMAAKKALEDTVEVTALYAKEGVCQPEFPYVYYVRNKSDQIVDSVSFNVYVRRVGFSSALNHIPEYQEFNSDKILKPGEGWGRCFRVNALGYPYAGQVTEKEVEIEVIQKVVVFKNR